MIKRVHGVESVNDISLTATLTEREIEILRLIANGMSNQEIAYQLSIAHETVKWYNKRIYVKLEVSSRTQAAARAQSLGLLNDRVEVSPSRYLLPQNNLPAQVTSFVGRQHEAAEIQRLFQNTRLLSLIGPAGCGKTRLAVQVAREILSHYEDGVYFIPLAPIALAENILWAIAEHIGLQLHVRSEPLEQLLNYFRQKTVLVILDNFEHLLEGGSLVTSLIRAAPDVRILVTSRERLNVYGETTYAIGGLSLSGESPSGGTPSEAVELFQHRALSVVPRLEFDVDELRHVVRICHLVEGMPLGIELAATWADVLSPQEIADEIENSLDILESELRDLPDSQNSMRASFARSWNLLNDAQKTAFRRLSVFRGGFVRHAAEAVAGVGLRALQALVSKSLIRYSPDSGRYEVHELLRQYAQEKLESSDEAPDVYAMYANHFADFMSEHWPQMKDERQQGALREIEADIENVRAAWRYWIREKNVSRLKQFLHSLWVIYDIRGWYPAGIELFEQAVEVMHTVATEEAQSALGWLLAAQGLYSMAGGMYSISGGTQKGFALAQQGVQLLERLNGYEEMMIIPLISMFITASLVNEANIALGAAQDCLEVATRIGDGWAIAKAKQFLTIRAINDEDYVSAERMAHEALNTFEESGDRWSESVLCIEVLGLLAITLRQFDRAKEWIGRGLKAAEEIDFKYSQQMAYWQLGYVAALQENYAEASLHWNRALSMGEGILGGGTIIGFGGTSNSGEWGGRILIKD